MGPCEINGIIPFWNGFSLVHGVTMLLASACHISITSIFLMETVLRLISSRNMKESFSVVFVMEQVRSGQEMCCCMTGLGHLTGVMEKDLKPLNMMVLLTAAFIMMEC